MFRCLVVIADPKNLMRNANVAILNKDLRGHLVIKTAYCSNKQQNVAAIAARASCGVH
jgi:hypothetical protein